MTKARLIKRLKWYYPVEMFHAFFTFPALLLYLLFSKSIQDVVFLTYGLIVCIVILYQGQHYWKLKLQRLMGKSLNQEKNLEFFRKSKRINIVLIALMSIFFVVQLKLQEWNITSNKMLFWGVLANVFAILEHINYYYIQLMIDNKYDMEYVIKNRRFKKASLSKDLHENKI